MATVGQQFKHFFFCLRKSNRNCFKARNTRIGSQSLTNYYGFIKQVWDVKNQSAVLVWDVKEHRKAVTCFSLFEPGESLLSGSADKTIRVC